MTTKVQVESAMKKVLFSLVGEKSALAISRFASKEAQRSGAVNFDDWLEAYLDGACEWFRGADVSKLESMFRDQLAKGDPSNES